MSSEAVPADTAPLGIARQWLRERLDDGAVCPCCQRVARVYRRTINAGMARSLITMWRAGAAGWVNVPEVVGARSREEGKLAYWGLVEEGSHRPDGGRGGWWRLTPAGIEFVLDRSRVPRYALVYAGRVLGHEGPLIGIADALGQGFDYAALMEGRP